MALLKLLRERDGLLGLELAVPNGAVEANPARDDMHMVNIGVMVTDHDILVIGQPHTAHEVGGNICPAIRGKAVPRGKRKAGVPNGAGNTGTRFPR